jgi:hypothetical protein
MDINLKNFEELEDEKESNNENHKSKESKEVKNEQLGYIESRSQMKNLLLKNINQMNNISLSSHKINFNHFHKLFNINEGKSKKTNEKSRDEIDFNYNLKNQNNMKFVKQIKNNFEEKKLIENNSEIMDRINFNKNRKMSNKILYKMENNVDSKKIELNKPKNNKN